MTKGEKKDDYPDFYNVYLLDECISGFENWKDTNTKNVPLLGEIKVMDVKFDVTRRKAIDSEIFTRFEGRA